MIKLFKNLEKKDYLIMLFVAVLVIFSVYLDLKLPEYMSDITVLVQTENSERNPSFRIKNDDMCSSKYGMYNNSRIFNIIIIS